MAANPHSASCALAARRAARSLLCLLILASFTLTGCGGCDSSTPAQKAAAKKKEEETKAAEEAKRKAEE